ncbi:MAG: hypothetical protein WAW17_23535 [Rhodococcus sp. (in: high G+C Gram-positive bacteria)]|uniref:hypothetical protein n=1 Tax=Rhodococcus sp. TaxID=1831 RepID=UPI003BAF30B0
MPVRRAFSNGCFPILSGGNARSNNGSFQLRGVLVVSLKCPARNGFAMVNQHQQPAGRCGEFLGRVGAEVFVDLFRRAPVPGAVLHCQLCEQRRGQRITLIDEDDLEFGYDASRFPALNSRNVVRRGLLPAR